MLGSGEIQEIAIRGEYGIDVFHRVETERERRYHYECIATVVSDGDGTDVKGYSDVARKNPDRMRKAAQRLEEQPWLGTAFSLEKLSSYPEPRIEVFHYLEFLRTWLVADLEISRVKNTVANGGQVELREISRVLRLLLNYNQVTRSAFFIDMFLPYLLQRAQVKRDDRWQNAGYSLRMIGDLQARAERFAEALSSYEAAINLGDNQHRRSLAIEAAKAAGNQDALLFHLQQYEEKWPLPAALSELRATTAGIETGETE